ncbi:MAG TPA: hypothetical protein ENK23_07170 [Sorangium sp.]|nr:hypothetical protein [Sorangium sp.]
MLHHYGHLQGITSNAIGRHRHLHLRAGGIVRDKLATARPYLPSGRRAGRRGGRGGGRRGGRGGGRRGGRGGGRRGGRGGGRRGRGRRRRGCRRRRRGLRTAARSGSE